MYISPLAGDTSSFGWLCWLLLIDSVVYFIIGIYIRMVFPGMCELFSWETQPFFCVVFNFTSECYNVMVEIQCIFLSIRKVWDWCSVVLPCDTILLGRYVQLLLQSAKENRQRAAVHQHYAGANEYWQEQRYINTHWCGMLDSDWSIAALSGKKLLHEC